MMRKYQVRFGGGPTEKCLQQLVGGLPYIADPTALPVCHNKRINGNRVFKGLAARGKTTMGWFYGLKLHLVINHKGSIVAVKITPGNVDERALLDEMTQNLKESLFADKGFISQDLFKKLFKEASN